MFLQAETLKEERTIYWERGKLKTWIETVGWGEKQEISFTFSKRCNLKEREKNLEADSVVDDAANFKFLCRTNRSVHWKSVFQAVFHFLERAEKHCTRIWEEISSLTKSWSWIIKTTKRFSNMDIYIPVPHPHPSPPHTHLFLLLPTFSQFITSTALSALILAELKGSLKGLH